MKESRLAAGQLVGLPHQHIVYVPVNGLAITVPQLYVAPFAAAFPTDKAVVTEGMFATGCSPTQASPFTMIAVDDANRAAVEIPP